MIIRGVPKNVCLLVILTGVLLSNKTEEATGEESEKLLFGFEKEECEKVAATIKSRGPTIEATAQGGVRFWPEYQCEDEWIFGGIKPMECAPGDATQGNLALRVPNSDSFARNGRRSYLYINPIKNAIGMAEDPRTNLRLPELLNTSTWFSKAFPEDWSGWDLLRVDVKAIHDRPVTIIVEVEDDMVEPPVSQTYSSIEPGKWVTLELDLAAAVQERKLNLKKMCNIFIRFDGRKDLRELAGSGAATKYPILEKAAVYLDNIRLAKKGAPCKTPVLKGERSSYTAVLPRSYGYEIKWETGEDIGKEYVMAKSSMPKPAKLPPSTGTVALSEPAIAELTPLLKKGYVPHKEDKYVTETNLHQWVILKAVTAASEKEIIVGFCMPGASWSMRFDKPGFFKFSPLVAIVTRDGGKSWGGFKGPGEPPTWLSKGRKAWEGTIFDCGADLVGLKDDGCLIFRTALEYYPADRVFFWRSVYTADGWKESPRYFISGDPRWCSHAAQNVLRLPSGRIWCMWSTRGRQGKGAVYAMYSDDEGVTWQSWRGPGLVGTVPLKEGGGTAGAVRAELFPWGEHVGMIARKGQWIYFDGKAWIEQPAAPIKVPVRVVACGREIYVVDMNGILQWYDGTAWKQLSLPGREEYPRFYRSHGNDPGDPEIVTHQFFVVCGETVLFIEVDKTGKKLLCWRKPKGGEWSGPQILVTEETPFADVTAPRYGVSGFVPVAYNCWDSDEKKAEYPKYYVFPRRELKPWIKVLKVPSR